MKTDLSSFLAGRLMLAQPEQGHRAGTDAALLAAGADPRPGDHLFDLGAGIGAAGLAVAVRISGVRVSLVEIDAAIAAIARENIARNKLTGRAFLIEADVTARLPPDGPLRPAGADQVIMNPPFHLPGTVRIPPSAYRAGAHILGAGGDEAWILAALNLLKPKGTLCLIHRADALPRLLAALDRRFGDIRIKPVHPRLEQPAARVLIRAIKASKAPLTLLPPLILHESGGHFTPQAEALHRGDAAIDWQMG